MTTPKYLTGDKEGIKDFLDQFEVGRQRSPCSVLIPHPARDLPVASFRTVG